MKLGVIHNINPDSIDEYLGFQSYRGEGSWLAVAMFDGEPDLYDCDGPEAQAEIERYYLDGYDRKPDTLAFYHLRRGEMKDHNSAEFHAEMLDREEEMHAFINKINKEKS